MGLAIVIDGDITQGIWRSTYVYFSLFRRHIADVLGISAYVEMVNRRFPNDAELEARIDAQVRAAVHLVGLDEFLGHKDNEGEWTPEECARVAQLLRRAQQCHNFFEEEYGESTAKLIAGLERCTELRKPAVFR